MTTAWTSEHLQQIDMSATSVIPKISAISRGQLSAELIYWDMWPIQQVDGRSCGTGTRDLWMVLTAPDRGNPSLRHFEAKIRLLERQGDQWTDLGDVLPDMAVPYQREWAGSAMCDGKTVSLYFTGAGLSDRPDGYQQRLFESHASLDDQGLPTGWSQPVLSIVEPSPHYITVDAHEGEAGKIKAFRDPAWFRDPANDAEYLIFTASLAGSSSEFNGAIGIARRSTDGWELLPPLIHADRVNNEMERAHVVYHSGRYYAFWATQRSTFAPELRHAPNGLYGMVADSLFGPYQPLNGSGLVLANPENDPSQTYSWFVSADLEVSSFVDIWGLDGAAPPVDIDGQARHFGGVPAPLLKLAVAGDNCQLIGQVDA